MDNIIKTDIGCHIFIECDCSSLDHIVKLGYIYDDQEFYIEFRQKSFPIIDRRWYSGNYYKLYRLKNYIINIWHAIKGKPNKYTIETLWGFKQAEQIQKFIEYCTMKYYMI